MKQVNKIGKYTLKDEVLNGKVGRTFLLPCGKEYQFKEYRKEGRRYIFVITYKGNHCQILESDFNRTDMEVFLTQADIDLSIV